RWPASAWPALTHSMLRLTPSPAIKPAPRIRIFSLSGKTPIPTSPSSSRPKRSTPGCGEGSDRCALLNAGEFFGVEEVPGKFNCQACEQRARGLAVLAAQGGRMPSKFDFGANTKSTGAWRGHLASHLTWGAALASILTGRG